MVIKVLAGIAVVIVVILTFIFLYNPLEKNRQHRDQRRVADLRQLKKAIDFYITKNAKALPPLCQNCAIGSDVFAFREIKLTNATVKVINKRFVNSHGWVPLDLSINAKLFGTPLNLLPIDPLEETFPIRQKLPIINGFFPSEKEDFVYTFTPGENGKYKLTAKMESETGLEEAKSDGGSLADRYEIGELSLVP